MDVHSSRERDTPGLTVILPTRNESILIQRSIEAVYRQDYAGPISVLVVDSGSTDGTAEAAQGAGADVLETDAKTFSHGRTRQLAAEKTRTEPLVFTVADAVPADAHWLENLVEPLENPDVAGAYGIQIAPQEASPVTLRRSRRREKLGPRTVRLPSAEAWEALPPRRKRDLASFDNCTSCIRRSLLLGDLPFPDVPFGEDMFWAARALKAGFAIVRVPKARVIHQHADTFGYLLRRMTVDAALCGRHFAYRPVPNLPYLLLRQALACFEALLASGIRGYGIPLHRPDRRILCTFKESWHALGDLLGKYLGSLPPAEDIPSWRPFKKWLSETARRIVEKAGPLRRPDISR